MTSNETEIMFNTKRFPQGIAVEVQVSKDKKYESYLTLGRGRKEVQPIQRKKKTRIEMIRRIKNKRS